MWDATIIMDEPVKLSKFVSKTGDKDPEFKGIKFTRTSPAREEGFPGKLEVSSWYLLSEDDKLLMVWEAKVIDDAADEGLEDGFEDVVDNGLTNKF